MSDDHMQDDDLKRAYAALRARRHAHSSDDRPDVDAIGAALSGDLSSDERERVLDAALRSGAADDVAMLHALTSAVRAAHSETTAQQAVRWRASRWVPIAAAATLMVMVGASFWLRDVTDPDDDALDIRFRDGRDISVSLIAPAMRTDTVNAFTTFIWHAVPDAGSYEFELFDAGGSVLFTQTVADTTATLPTDMTAETRARAAAWWITTTLPDGRRLRSELRLLRPAVQP